MEYTTLATLKEYLGITDTASDTLLENLIKRCTQQFDKYLGRNLENKSYTEYIVVDDEDILIVSNGPINSITSLQQDDSDGDNVEYTRIDGNIVYLPETYDGTLYIEYEAGYTTLDDILDVEQACLEVCNDFWSNTPISGFDGGVKSKSIETLSKTYFSKQEMSGGNNIDFRETLDNYKIFNPLIV